MLVIKRAYGEKDECLHSHCLVSVGIFTETEIQLHVHLRKIHETNVVKKLNIQSDSKLSLYIKK